MCKQLTVMRHKLILCDFLRVLRRNPCVVAISGKVSLVSYPFLFSFMHVTVRCGADVLASASDFKGRKALAWGAFWKLERLWRSSELPISTKIKLFHTTCVTILLYGCESWVLSQDMLLPHHPTGLCSILNRETMYRTPSYIP